MENVSNLGVPTPRLVNIASVLVFFDSHRRNANNVKHVKVALKKMFKALVMSIMSIFLGCVGCAPQND